MPDLASERIDQGSIEDASLFEGAFEVLKKPPREIGDSVSKTDYDQPAWSDVAIEVIFNGVSDNVSGA